MFWKHTREYIVAFIISGLLFFSVSAYLFFRQGYLDLGVFDLALPNTSTLLLGLVLLIGPLTRNFDLFDSLIKYRKEVGIVAFAYALLHGLISYFLAPQNYINTHYRLQNPPFLFGLTGLLLLALLYILSIESLIAHLPRKLWWAIQNWGVRAALLLVIGHMLLLNSSLWLKWVQRGDSSHLLRSYLPPLNLIVAILLFFVILVRVSEFWTRTSSKRMIILYLVIIFYITESVFSWGILRLPHPVPTYSLCKKLPGSQVTTLESGRNECRTANGSKTTESDAE